MGEYESTGKLLFDKIHGPKIPVHKMIVNN